MAGIVQRAAAEEQAVIKRSSTRWAASDPGDEHRSITEDGNGEEHRDNTVAQLGDARPNSGAEHWASTGNRNSANSVPDQCGISVNTSYVLRAPPSNNQR